MPTTRRLAAIMFTDIVGYTALMQRSEQEAVATVKRHQEILEAEVVKHDGEVLQYYGDGSLSIFPSAVQAVTCAVEIQKQYRQPPRVPLRIGIHMGEVLFEDGKALGDCINLASRIESLARAGSVLISEKTALEIGNKNHFELKNLGRFRLKNVFQPVKVYSVIHEDLYVPERHELEGKVETKEKIYDLPSYPDAFIGRSHHLQAIRTLLQSDGKRLITLLGPGGMGKTRLSVRTGEHMAEDFEHGVCFVALDAVTDHRQAPLYIGHRLGLKTSFHTSWLDEIIAFLKDKHLLLILDNLEQILDTAEHISRILETCPRVHILATSREVLGLSHEVEYPLDSLNRPNPRLFPSPEQLLRFDAIELFVKKAQTSLPSFELNEENATAIVEICQELEGLPLPIELAAARVKLFSPELILKKLHNNSNLLRTRSRDVAARHQTIRNTVKWSYDLLDQAEQEWFQQLALFSGGFTSEALESINPEYDSLDVIESFLNKSLIVKEAEVADTSRFRMLKLIRDFGLEQLEQNPKQKEYCTDFARYFVDFVEEAGRLLRGPSQARWIALMEAEYENIGVTLEWLIAHQPQKAARLGANFWRFHLSRSFLREGLGMVQRLLTLPIEVQEIKARLLEGAGTLSHNLGDYQQAKDYFSHSLEIRKALGNKTDIIKSLNNLGWAEWRVGNYEHSLSYSADAFKLSLEINDRQGQATAMNNQGWTLLHRGLFDKAERLQRQILSIHSQANNDRGIAFARTNLGWALIRLGKLPEAASRIDEGVRLFEELKDQQLTAFSRMIKSEYWWETGQLSNARKILEADCLTSFERIGDLYGLANTHRYLGSIYLQEQNHKSAAFHLNTAMDLFRDSSDQFGQAIAALHLSQLEWIEGRFTTPNEYLDQCLTLAAAMEAYALLTDGHFELGRRAVRQRSFRVAIIELAVADHYAEKLGPYQYQKFLSNLQSHLSLLQKGHSAMNTRFDKPWPLNHAYLAKPIEENVLFDHIHKLLNLPVATSFPAPPAGQVPGLQENTQPQTGSPEREDPFVCRFRQVIERHLSNPGFTVKDLCRAMGMSHSQLHRRITEHTGQSITKFMRSIQLEKARELLLDPDLTVAAVAYDAGFRDPDYFYRVFRQAFDMTPGEFRESMLKNE